MHARPAAAPRAARLAFLAETPVSFALAAASVAVLAWAEAHGRTADVATLVRFGALERSRVWDGEVWRLLAAAFLHAGWLHLAWNVAVGVPWCRPVERAVGPLGLLAVYLASAVGASALSLLGQDVVSAGASGALFGVVGATLALHRRGLPGWRAFLRSGATRWVVAGLLGWSVVGGLFLPLDHLAHGGGLAAGAAAAWLISRPPPRRALPWAALAVALAALAAAASWPRATPSRFEGAELEEGVHAALLRGDDAEARRLLARADARRWWSEGLGYYRALLLVREDDLEGALAIARPLTRAAQPAVREEARKLAAGLARNLGYRHYTGEGAPRDVRLALGYFEEACALGDEEGCRTARAIAGW